MVQLDAYAFQAIPSISDKKDIKAIGLWVGTGFFGILSIIAVASTIGCIIRDKKIFK
jgi:hypothetical protein